MVKSGGEHRPSWSPCGERSARRACRKNRDLTLVWFRPRPRNSAHRRVRKTFGPKEQERTAALIRAVWLVGSSVVVRLARRVRAQIVSRHSVNWLRNGENCERCESRERVSDPVSGCAGAPLATG